MPETVLAIATAAGQFAGQAVAAAGGGYWAITTTTAVVTYGTLAAATYGLSVAARPDIPAPEVGEQNFKQPIPLRRYVLGEARLGGPVALYEAAGTHLHQIALFCDQPIAEIGANDWWINDDRVTRLASGPLAGYVEGRSDGAYADSNAVYIDYRRGFDSQTVFTPPLESFTGSAIPGSASTDRLDGIAAGYIRARHGKLENFTRHYPAGIPTLSARVQGLFFDWRDGDQVRTDKATWKVSRNPIVCLAWYLMTGLGRSWATDIAPRLAEWTRAANDCDDAIALAGGGTVPRYQVAGWFDAGAEPRSIVQEILAACDGFLVPNITGGWSVSVGKTINPTVTINERVIRGISARSYIRREDAVSVLLPSFVDPANEYREVSLNEWSDADMLARFGRITQPFAPRFSATESQTRRLAKIAMSRAKAQYAGTVQMDLSAALMLRGQRYFRIEAGPFYSVLGLPESVVAEIPPGQSIVISGINNLVTVPFVAVDIGRYSWDAATEEAPITLPTAPSVSTLDQPTIDSVEVLTDTIGYGDVRGTRLVVTVTGPARGDLTWEVEFRAVGETRWVPVAVEDAPGSTVPLLTGIVPADQPLELRARYVTGGNRPSDWSDTYEFSTVIPLILAAEGSPLSFADGSLLRSVS